MLALRRAVVAALDTGRLAQGDDRPRVAVRALRVDAVVVVAHVERRGLGGKAARVELDESVAEFSVVALGLSFGGSEYCSIASNLPPRYT